MIRLDVEQGSPEWVVARIGMVTASKFDSIITNATAKRSSSFEKYAHDLLAEQILGVKLDGASSGFMERGTLLEHKARTWYELEHDCDTEAVGFVMRDDRRVGCSPDRFVGDTGMLEIKCPSAGVHVGYLLDEKGIGYRAQVQGQLWICEREWVDTLSYNPDMPQALVRQYRDEDFIKALAAGVNQFLMYMDECKARLQRRGLFPDFKVEPLRVVA